MNKTLSPRRLRLVNLARSVPYSLEDIALLQGILNGTGHDDLWADLFDFKHGRGIGVVEDGHNPERYAKELNLLQYLLVDSRYRKIFLFMTIVPFDEVPKYIAHKELAPFAEWRLKIRK